MNSIAGTIQILASSFSIEARDTSQNICLYQCEDFSDRHCWYVRKEGQELGLNTWYLADVPIPQATCFVVKSFEMRTLVKCIR